jgi:acetylornithine deacetylase/succinyl-diaminopimelate desuccinylase-like protein
LRLRIFGRAGHASVPARADNPVRHAATAVERLASHETRPSPGPATARALRALGAPGDGEDAITWAGDQHPLLADLLPGMTRMTITPTGLETFEPANVIPPFADVICDCRALPEQTEADIRVHVARALGEDGPRYELDLLEPLEGGTESPIDTPLYRILEEYEARRLDGARLLPIISAGFTDSHWVRKELGTVAYGFAPVFETDPQAYEDAAHAADESLEIADLAEMAEFNLHVLRTLGPPM